MTEQFPTAGQPWIYAGAEKVTGRGMKLLFVKTHGRTALHVTISRQDYETMMRDGQLPSSHPEEWCSQECACYQVGKQHAREL